MRGRSAPADNRSGSGLLRRSRAWRWCLQGRRRWRTSAPDDELSTSAFLPWVESLSGLLSMDCSPASNARKAPHDLIWLAERDGLRDPSAISSLDSLTAVL